MTVQSAVSRECNSISIDREHLKSEVTRCLDALTTDLSAVRRDCADGVKLSAMERNVHQLRWMLDNVLTNEKKDCSPVFHTMGLNALIDSILDPLACAMTQYEVIPVIHPVDPECFVYAYPPLICSMTELVLRFSQLLEGKGGLIEFSATPGKEFVNLVIDPLPYIEHGLVAPQLHRIHQVSRAGDADLRVYSGSDRLYTVTSLPISFETGESNATQH